MTHRILFVVALLAFAPSAFALWSNEWIVGEACSNSALISFDKCNPEDYKCLCGSKNFLATVALCISERANTSARTRDDAWDHFTYTTCEIHDATASDKDYREAMVYLNQTVVQAMPQTSSDSAGSWGQTDFPDIAHPVKIPDDVFEIAKQSVYHYRKNKDIGVWQGSFLVGYWVFIFLFVALVRLKRWTGATFVGLGTHMHKPSRMYRWYQKFILMPALFGKRHMERIHLGLGFNLSVPTRFETVVIAIYFILHVVFDCAPYTFLDNDPLYPTQWKQMVRYVSDRSGIIGVIQLPLLTLFAMRNNFIIWMTGWSFATFNTYHRAIVRITYCQFIVHSVTKHVFSVSYGGSLVQYFYPVPYYRYGVAGMFLMAIMIASGHFRQNHYELFLRLHIPCAIGAYLMILYHLNGLGYKQTVYVSFGIWCADWAIRLFRLVFNNMAIYFPPAARSRAARLTRATVSITGNDDCANVKVRTPVLWKPSPGQYVFIHFSRFHFWEAHPFSVVGPSDDGESFQLFCRKRNGMTKKLINQLMQCEQMNRSVFVEGPYGVHSPVERYSNALFIAGGVGITGVLPYVEYLANSDNCITSQITFVWTVSSVADTAWIHDRLTRLFRGKRVDIQIYVGKGINRPKSILGSLRRPGSAMYKMKQRFSVARRSRDYSLESSYTGTQNYRDSSTNTSQSSSYNAEKDKSSPNKRPLSISISDVSPNSTFVYPRSPIEKSMRRSTNPSKPVNESQMELLSEKPPIPLTDDSKSELQDMEQVPLEKTTEWYYLLKNGRPNLQVLVEDFVVSAEGSVCVLGCGPPGLMDSIRKEVASNIDRASSGRVDYFEEAFGW